MNAPCNRLMKARRVAGFRSARAASATLGVKSATYAAHENGSRTFSITDARRYAELYNVSPGWILTGERFKSDTYDTIGDEPLDQPSNGMPPQKPAAFRVNAAGLSNQEIFEFGKQTLDLLTQIAPTPETQTAKGAMNVAEVFIPEMVGDTVEPGAETWQFTGQWQLPSKYISDVLQVPPNDVAILAVVDDNMSPAYNIGDRLIVNFLQKHFTVDGVYFFLTEDGSIHIQNVKRLKTQYKLLNNNRNKSEKHPEKTVNHNKITFQGKICGIIAAC